MQKARGHPATSAGLPLLERNTFQGLFHPPSGVLFTIDLCTCLGLGSGPPRFRPDFTCPTLLRDTLPCFYISATGLSPTLAARSRVVRLCRNNRILGPYNPPPIKQWGLACSHFARHYFGNLY